MNRIVIIGNGFDLAHGLKTGYGHFIDYYWKRFISKTFEDPFLKGYKDDLLGIELEIKNDKYLRNMPNIYLYDTYEFKINNTYSEFKNEIEKFNAYYERIKESCRISLTFKNSFLERILAQSLENWVDIEKEYYDAIKDIILEVDREERSKLIKELNVNVKSIQNLLEAYLYKVTTNNDLNIIPEIIKTFTYPIVGREIAVTKKVIRKKIDKPTLMDYICPKNTYHIERMFDSTENTNFDSVRLMPEQTLILNFNYTKTIEKYKEAEKLKVLNIHGELRSEENPIIFGYGDELDEHYKKIENLDDNNFVEHFKSSRYGKTRNYREMLQFIEADHYQVFIMGHSCGNSDRTLLNTLFEHDNCCGVKVFYHQYGEDENSNNYNDLYINISRNFKDKQKLRDIVVNKLDCEPLIPYEKKTATE